MTILVNRFAIIIFLLLGSAITYAQDSLISWNERTSLAWEDFSGKVNDTSHFEAECSTQVKYSYEFDGLTDFHFTVQAFFDKSTSWIKPGYRSDGLLKHEQVHFNIAHLFACKLQQAFEDYVYTSNYAEEIVQIFEKLNKQYHDTQKLYDEQSNHSLVASRQKRWETFVEQALGNPTVREQGSIAQAGGD